MAPVVFTALGRSFDEVHCLPFLPLANGVWWVFFEGIRVRGDRLLGEVCANDDCRF